MTEQAPPTAAGYATTPRSPFSGVLAPTHFARFVIIRLDRAAPHLFFSSAFDGDTVEYLRALAATPEADWTAMAKATASVGHTADAQAAFQKALEKLQA